MTTATDVQETIHTLRIEQSIDIAADPATVFQSILDMLGPESRMGDTPYPMKLEPWPGGRWFRDLGNNTGHHWAHVQVIKPPPHPQPLLELSGPLFMSYPAISHVQYRVVPNGDRSTLKLTHRAMGLITEDHRTGVNEGWADELSKIKALAEKRAR